MRVMLVEDDLQLGAALNRAFELNGFESLWVRRLKEARAFMEGAAPSVIILDLGLPDGEGLTLLQFVRGQEKAVPVIVVTARDSLEDCVQALNNGADDYVTKPVAVPELVARIHAVLRRSAGFATDQWVFGELSIDLTQHSVSLRGEPVPLTPTEFKLLVELARHSGRVIPRETLIALIWGATADGSDTALDYQVHGLRKKIGSQRVLTVRGIGFRMGDV
jgi:DNA-binding response OmpR family regulator